MAGHCTLPALSLSSQIFPSFLLSALFPTSRILFGFPFNAGAYFKKKPSSAAASSPAARRVVGRIDAGVAATVGDIPRDKGDAGFFMTEAACIRFAVDYGLAPHLVTKKEIRAMVQELNRPKTLYIAKPVTKPKVSYVF